MSQPQKQTDEPTFEDAMERLEEIVSAMESDRMPLEEMMDSYEEGVRLLKVCRQRIETARRRVELITANIDAGKATLEPFDESTGASASTETEAASDDDSARSKTRRRKADADADAEDHDIRLF